MLKRDRIVLIPYVYRRYQPNEHELKKLNLIKKHYIVDKDFADPIDLFTIIRTRAVIMGWMEEHLDARSKRIILLYKLLGAKIIWTFHNKAPHDAKDTTHVINNMRWLADTADVIFIHSKSSADLIPGKMINKLKAFYVPHIGYDMIPVDKYTDLFRDEYGIKKDDFVFLCFGLIRPYKNIESSIRAFLNLNKPNTKLIIAGKDVDKEYADFLIKEARNNPNIIFVFKHISDPLLSCILDISDVVLITYHTETCINSGVMIHSFSAAKTVVMPDMCSARDYKDKEFIYIYNGDDIEEALNRAYNAGKDKNHEFGIDAMDEMKRFNNVEEAEKAIISAIG